MREIRKLRVIDAPPARGRFTILAHFKRFRFLPKWFSTYQFFETEEETTWAKVYDDILIMAKLPTFISAYCVELILNEQ